MRVGLLIDEFGATLDDVLSQVRAAAAARFAAAWISQRSGWDALTLLALAGREVDGIDLGVPAVPTYPRHPLALAGQVRSVQAAATTSRLTVGVGVNHRFVMTDQFGYSFDRPARHLREYLTALRPLLRGDTADVHGETLTAVGSVDVPGAGVGTDSPSLLVAALGPAMLRVAGELADGTVTMWAGPRALAEHVVPSLAGAAARAGRGSPRVVASGFVCLTTDPAGRRATVAEQFGPVVDNIPSYRAILDHEGVEGPADTVVAGDDAAVEQGLRRLVDAGATELIAIPLGTDAEQARTRELLADLNTARTTGR